MRDSCAGGVNRIMLQSEAGEGRYPKFKSRIRGGKATAVTQNGYRNVCLNGQLQSKIRETESETTTRCTFMRSTFHISKPPTLCSKEQPFKKHRQADDLSWPHQAKVVFRPPSCNAK